MKNLTLIAAVGTALTLTACTLNDNRLALTPDQVGQDAGKEVTATEVGHPGAAIIKVDESLGTLLEKAGKEGLVRTKSELVDDAFGKIGVYEFERVFPDAGEYEERTRREGLHLFYTVKYDKSVAATRAGEMLSAVDGIVKVETPHKIKRRSVVPNDPYFKYQWDMINDKSLDIFCSYPSVPYTNKGADMNLAEVWEHYTTGDSRVIVNVVDGGVDINHPDLVGVVLPGGANGSKDFVGNSYRITPDDHGTHVAGTIAAVRNNGVGVSGVAGGDYAAGKQGVRIISSQIFKGNYGASDAQTANAVKWGADHGALISQNSWGWGADEDDDGIITEEELRNYKSEGIPEYLRAAIDYFIKYAGCDNSGNQKSDSMMKGGLVIFAAGNEDIDYDMVGSYDPVISVAAGTAGYTKAFYSNYGDWVDLIAPGGDGLDTQTLSSRYFGDKDSYGHSRGEIYNLQESTYTYMSGTSMACPHVSGAAALIVSAFGGPGFTNTEAKKALLDGANYQIVQGKQVGGWVDVANSFRIAGHGSFVSPSIVRGISVEPGKKALIIKYEIPDDPDEDKAAGVICLISTHKDMVASSTATYTQSDVTRFVWETGDAAVGDEVTKYVDGLRHGTTYYIGFIAYDKSNNYSDLSEIVSGTTLPNHAPFVKTTPADQIIYGLNSSMDFDLTDMFGDVDEDELNYQVSTSDHDVTQVYLTGRSVKVIARGAGVTSLTVRADDGDRQCSTKFQLMVKPNAADPVETYPNPITTKLTIRTEAEAETYVRIVSSTGKVVYEATKTFSGFNPLSIDTTDLAPGRYSVTVKYNGKVFHKTIVKV